MYKLRDLVSLSLNDYYKLNDEIFNVFYNKLYDEFQLLADNETTEFYINISDIVLCKLLGAPQSKKVSLFELLQNISKYLNHLFQNSLKIYVNIRENNNKELRVQNIQDILNNISQYIKDVDVFTSTMQNEWNSIKSKMNRVQYIKDIDGSLFCINGYNKYLSGIYHSYLKDIKSNNISDNYLYELITYFEDTNIRITEKINNILIMLIENVIKQSSSDNYEKYCNDLSIIKDLNNDNNVLTINYCYNLKNQYELGYFLREKILENLSYFYNITNIESLIKNIETCKTYKNIINDLGKLSYFYNITNIESLIKNIETCKTYKNIINDLENITINYKININPEYVEKYTQIINEFAKNIPKTCEKCKLLINNIKNKAKELLERNGNSLSKQLQDNTKNTDTLQNNIEDNKKYSDIDIDNASVIAQFDENESGYI